MSPRRPTTAVNYRVILGLQMAVRTVGNQHVPKSSDTLAPAFLLLTVPTLPLSPETFQAQDFTRSPQHLLQKLP